MKEKTHSGRWEPRQIRYSRRIASSRPRCRSPPRQCRSSWPRRRWTARRRPSRRRCGRGATTVRRAGSCSNARNPWPWPRSGRSCARAATRSKRCASARCCSTCLAIRRLLAHLRSRQAHRGAQPRPEGAGCASTAARSATSRRCRTASSPRRRARRSARPSSCRWSG